MRTPYYTSIDEMNKMAQTNGAKFVPLLDDTVMCLFFSMNGADNLDWDDLCMKLNNSIRDLSGGYIWHRDEFKVHKPIVQDNNEDLPEHLLSITTFGDNMLDEWFIVYLVLKLSKEYSNLVIQMRDEDGEFLLIEAADHLPSWAKPDTTHNRVFIYQGQLHMIPPSCHSDKEMKLQEAIEFIASVPEFTVATKSIQKAILDRVDIYPQRDQDAFHHAVAKLPVELAALLVLKPALIAPVANAYLHHDVIDEKAIKHINYDNCVKISVKFTKILYALLMHAKPPKVNKFRQMLDKKCVLGYKLTAGYQILMNNTSSDIFSSRHFNTFKSKLKASGYFKQNIEGSKDYNELLESAKEFYSVMDCPINAQVSSEINDLKESTEFELTREKLLTNVSSGEVLREDDERWLLIDTDQLNEMLNKRYGKIAKLDDNMTANNVTSELSSFLIRTSDFEGIETTRDDSTGNVEFEADEFVNAVEKMLDMLTVGKEEESDSDEDFINGDDIEEDEELKGIKDEVMQDNKTILRNIILGMKEEGLSGPTSNFMNSAGFNKTDFLDSDDDDE